MAIRELDLERDLNDYLAGGDQPKDDKWQIDNEKDADWALRKIRQAQARIAEVEEFAQKRIEEIEAWASNITVVEQRTIERFTALLEMYHRKVYEGDPRAKTIKLPAGQLQLRQAQPQYVRDDQSLVAWLKERYPELVKVVESPNWAEAKKRFIVNGSRLVDPNTGEIVEGVEVHQLETPVFRVKINREEG